MKSKPNGNAEDARKAKGCFGKPVYINKKVRPYKAYSDVMSPRSPSMKDIYEGLKRGQKVKRSDPTKKNKARRLRRKLAETAEA